MNSRIRFISATAAAILALGFGGSAANAVAPTSQGSAEGVLYVAEITDNTVYIGDIGNPATALTAFWSLADSKVDQVAVTSGYVAWASGDDTSSISNKVLIAPIGLTAANIVTVDLPGASTDYVTGLAADATGTLIYASVGDTIYAINATTGTYVTSYTDSSVSDISWGLWVDGYNDRVYYCDAQGNTGDVYGGNLSGTGVASSVVVIHAEVNGSCDGIGNDPVTGRVYIASYDASTFTVDPMIFAWMNGDGSGTPTEIALPNAASYVLPSSMYVSHDTGKIFWAEEGYVREMNFDGSGLRTLYTGTHPVSGGFENLAVTFGTTLSDLSNSGGGSGGGGSNGGGSNGGSSSEGLASTGGNDVAATIAVLLGLVALGAGIVARRRA